MKRRTFLATAIGAIGASAACTFGTWPAGARLHTGTALAFGTTINIAVVHADEKLARRAIAAALSAAQQVDRLMSIYHPASQVFRLNRDGVLHQPDPQLLAVLEQARGLSLLTDGAFDISVQPLWRAYSTAAARGALPDAAQQDRALALVDWRGVRVSADRIELAQHGMAITLNGLAQGYAADLALAAVRAHGIEHALLDTGEFAAAGRKHGRPWTLGVRAPRDPQALAATLCLDGRSMATSGDYEMTFTPDYMHHHIFDPKAGDSPRQLANVTVLAPSAMLADGLSTAFMVLGADRSMTLAARLTGVDLLAIDKAGRPWRSAGIAPAAV